MLHMSQFLVKAVVVEETMAEDVTNAVGILMWIHVVDVLRFTVTLYARVDHLLLHAKARLNCVTLKYKVSEKSGAFVFEITRKYSILK